ncbi:major facilitator superfamily domain-containing protein [Truncatella angustata]|uniref:Major facilitator superfamily domain-containing protein n=1 Tax=Truncatella angustata TaxID=152316 RepID=A0A9P8UBS8_9PEZI|nr:major facilitator superfamily domain-containing protein [Truncatella angustata]KAH6645305.1 major facilitator superfamily domain-containing protein [Truncatella angustata]
MSLRVTPDLKDDVVGTDPKPSSGRTITGLPWVLICVSLYISIFIYGLDTSIAADVQGAVVEVFGHVEQLAWIGAGFPLGSVAVVLLNGVLYTNFDMKWVYIATLAIFEVGSALCGAAPNMSALIVGRAIAGAGGNGVFQGSLNMFSSLTSPEERGLYITGIGFCWGIGAVLGPVVGGSFVVSSATWRWAFYINLIIGAAFAPIYVFYLPSVHPVTGVSVADRIKKIDSVGLLLGAGLWVSFTVAFTLAGGQWPWQDGRTIATIVALVLIMVLYAAQQVFCVFTTVESRSFPIHLLRSKSQVLFCISTAANITSVFVVVYFIPIYFQFVHGDTALQAAVRLLPYVIVTVCFNLGAGHLLSKVKYYMPLFVISGVFITLGASLLTAYLEPATPQGYIYGFTIITAVGSGLSMQIGYAVSTLKASDHIGDALAVMNVAQIGGSVIALVIAGQVFQSTATNNLSVVLAETGYTLADIQSIVSGAQSHLFEELSVSLRNAAIIAVTQAIQRAFILVCVGGGVLTIAGLLMKREKLFAEIVRIGV